MATADQIRALIRSRLEDDDAQFFAVAMQIAAHAARRGHGRLATDIRELVDEAKQRASTGQPIPLAAPKGELEGLLEVSYPDDRLSHLVLEAGIRKRLDRIIQEYQARGRLRTHGLQPRRKFLLVGPPGSGKTYTASALAGELRLPLLVIRLDGLITKFMGETSAKLRLVFDAMVETNGVYLFDEFDAIGSERGGQADVGEIRRVLNSFLLLIEQDRSDSVIVAATNHPGALDRALFRRFDDIITYAVPGPEQAEKALRIRLGRFRTEALDWEVATAAADGLSYADLTRACEDAAKDAILDGTDAISTDRLLGALEDRKAAVPM